MPPRPPFGVAPFCWRQRGDAAHRIQEEGPQASGCSANLAASQPGLNQGACGVHPTTAPLTSRTKDKCHPCGRERPGAKDSVDGFGVAPFYPFRQKLLQAAARGMCLDSRAYWCSGQSGMPASQPVSVMLLSMQAVGIWLQKQYMAHLCGQLVTEQQYGMGHVLGNTPLRLRCDQRAPGAPSKSWTCSICCALVQHASD
jgi:hypothetical protein